MSIHKIQQFHWSPFILLIIKLFFLSASSKLHNPLDNTVSTHKVVLVVPRGSRYNQQYNYRVNYVPN